MCGWQVAWANCVTWSPCMLSPAGVGELENRPSVSWMGKSEQWGKEIIFLLRKVSRDSMPTWLRRCLGETLIFLNSRRNWEWFFCWGQTSLFPQLPGRHPCLCFRNGSLELMMPMLHLYSAFFSQGARSTFIHMISFLLPLHCEVLRGGQDRISEFTQAGSLLWSHI